MLFSAAKQKHFVNRKVMSHNSNRRKIETNLSLCEELTSSKLRTEPRADHLQRTQLANRLSSQLSAVVPTPSIAELVPSVFSVHNHSLCGGPNPFSQENTRVYLNSWQVALITARTFFTFISSFRCSNI